MQKIPGIFRLILLLISISVIVILTQHTAIHSSRSAERASILPDAVWLYDNWKVDVSPTRGIILDIERQARVNSPQGRAVGRLKIWETLYQSRKSFRGNVTDTLGGTL